MTSVANYEVFVPNSTKISIKATCKMAAVQRTKKLRTLLKYLKLALIAELNMFTRLWRYFSKPRATNYV